MFLLDILRERGFKLIEGRHLDYSTMISNGIQGKYSDGNISVIWGLHEVGKPPTLIHPRPNIIGTKEITIDGKLMRIHGHSGLDDFMNECLHVFDHNKIADAILNPKLNIIFDLNNKIITNK